MELSIERMMESLLSAIGLGRHSAIIIAALGMIYFVLDQTYKSVNYKFYKIPRKYFKLINLALCQILGRLIDLSLSFYVKIDICTFLFLYT